MIVCILVFFETGSCYIDQPGLELMSLLPLPFECWICRCAPSHPTCLLKKFGLYDFRHGTIACFIKWSTLWSEHYFYMYQEAKKQCDSLYCSIVAVWSETLDNSEVFLYQLFISSLTFPFLHSSSKHLAIHSTKQITPIILLSRGLFMKKFEMKQSQRIANLQGNFSMALFRSHLY
jgi:hypothetical protein